MCLKCDLHILRAYIRNHWKRHTTHTAGKDAFDAYENENVADSNKAMCAELLKMLKSQFDTP